MCLMKNVEGVDQGNSDIKPTDCLFPGIVHNKRDKFITPIYVRIPTNMSECFFMVYNFLLK